MAEGDPMRKSLVLAAVLAAGLMGCKSDNEDSDRPDPGMESTRTGGERPSGATAGPDRGTRSGGQTGAGTGTSSGTAGQTR
jgi:hypothetical protein